MSPEPELPHHAAAPPDLFREPLEGPSTLACGGPRSPRGRPTLGDDCWFLTGPTAAGKSALAIPMARCLEADIVSVDSMAVYRGLDIGTAKPSPSDRAAVPHYCIDLVSPAEAFSVAEWLAAAADAVEHCRARGRNILFVGGTPLYLRALRDGLADLPPADTELRATLVAEADSVGPEPLHARLAPLDPDAAGRIHPRDTKRIVRALEVCLITGRPLSIAQTPAHDPIFERRLMVLDVARGELAARIDRRVEAMFAGGIIDETEAAMAAPGGMGPTACQAPGYSEAMDLLAGESRPEDGRTTDAGADPPTREAATNLVPEFQERHVDRGMTTISS